MTVQDATASSVFQNRKIVDHRRTPIAIPKRHLGQ